MTVGRFLTGSTRFFINFVVILIFGMTTYYIYSGLTTLPPDAVALDLMPEGTSFGVDPAEYLTGDNGIDKIVKGDYFVGENGLDTSYAQRDAVQQGFTYYPYDYSYAHPASSIYSNAYMTGINMWVGSRGLLADLGKDDYDYDAERPRLDDSGNSLIAPTFHFDNLDEMKTYFYSVYTGSDKYIADTVIAYWYLRVGSQGNAYVNAKAERMMGRGLGSGGMGAVALRGDMLLTALSFTFYGYKLDKTSTIIMEANSAMAVDVLGGLLTVADFKFSGWGPDKDANGNDLWCYYAATAAAEKTKLSSDAYKGPDGVYKSYGKGDSRAPTETELWAIYNAQIPSKTTYENGKNSSGNAYDGFNPDENTLAADGSFKLCEFGMPADTFSDHIINFTTIKSAELVEDAEGYVGADIQCYSTDDGEEWGFVSEAAARGIANGIGGFVTNGGIVDYLTYTRLTASITVWNNGLLRSWDTSEDWLAGIVTTVNASVAVSTGYAYSYDVNDILADQLGLGVSLPGQLQLLTSYR
ncbi:MAG: hypothetical protein LBQ40_02230 [Clostridiales bacterium]|jgi:hypothetical protein|nr:hypothetical protein [Clostridiales bacterium]